MSTEDDFEAWWNSLPELPDGRRVVSWDASVVTVDWDAQYYECARKYGLEYLFPKPNGPAP